MSKRNTIFASLQGVASAVEHCVPRTKAVGLVLAITLAVPAYLGVGGIDLASAHATVAASPLQVAQIIPNDPGCGGGSFPC